MDKAGDSSRSTRVISFDAFQARRAAHVAARDATGPAGILAPPVDALAIGAARPALTVPQVRHRARMLRHLGRASGEWRAHEAT